MADKLIFQRMYHKEFDVYVGALDIESLRGIYISKPLKQSEDSLYIEDSTAKGVLEDSIAERDFLKVNQQNLLVQRPKIPKKIREIAEYLTNSGGLGFFPNSIILGNYNLSHRAFTAHNLQFLGDNFFEIQINKSVLNEENKLFIIDGQHRIEGAMVVYYQRLANGLKLLLRQFKHDDDLTIINTLESVKYKDLSSKLSEIIKYIDANTIDELKQVESYEVFLDLLDRSDNYGNIKEFIVKNQQIGYIKLREKLLGKSYLLDAILDKFKKNHPDDCTDLIESSNNINFSIIIFDNISKSKMTEIFTDINSSATRLNTNTTRYFYGRLTTKEPFLTISVNIGKILNENPKSPLYGYIGMPYAFDKKKNVQVSISAFCQRFSEFGEISFKKITNPEKLDFYSKPFGIFIFHKYIKDIFYDKAEMYQLYENNQVIEDAIVFYSRLFAYCYEQYIQVYFELVNQNDKSAKFIDSSTNQLYMYITKLILVKIIESNDFNIENILTLGLSEDIGRFKKEVNSAFSGALFQSLKDTYGKYDNFRKGSKKNQGTGGAKSLDIMNTFKVYYFKDHLMNIKNYDSIEDYLDKDVKIKDDIKTLENKYKLEFNKKIIDYFK